MPPAHRGTSAPAAARSIFRTYFKYCEVGEDGKTPAMRLGLARGRLAPEDIVYFTPEQPARRRSLPSSVRPEILRSLQP